MQGGWLRALIVALTILAWIAVIVVIGWLLSHVGHAVLMLILATVVAFAVTPVVNFLARYIPRLAAIAATYLLVFVLILVLVGVIIATVASQVTSLIHNLPDYARRTQEIQPHLVSLLAPFGVTAAQIDSLRTEAVNNLKAFGERAASDALGTVRSFLSVVIDAVLVLMLSIYLTANGPKVRAWLQEQTPTAHRGRTRLLIGIVNRVVGGYIRGTLLLATLIGVLVGVGMGVLQVRYALLLGVLAFFMEFVPILGVFISGGVCVAVALFQSPLQALLVLGVFVLVHIFEGDVVGPRVMGAAVGIHPAVALLALVAGTELFGIWGALFGAPLAGLLQAIVTAAWQEVRAGATEFGKEAVEKKPPPRVEKRRARSMGE